MPQLPSLPVTLGSAEQILHLFCLCLMPSCLTQTILPNFITAAFCYMNCAAVGSHALHTMLACAHVLHAPGAVWWAAFLLKQAAGNT